MAFFFFCLAIIDHSQSKSLAVCKKMWTVTAAIPDTTISYRIRGSRAETFPFQFATESMNLGALQELA